VTVKYNSACYGIGSKGLRKRVSTRKSHLGSLGERISQSRNLVLSELRPHTFRM
jgi:hypothetical protein